MIRDISIVIPIYNEQDNIIQLIKEVGASLEKKINYEIIIVDDGSDDNTYEVVNKINKKNESCWGASGDHRGATKGPPEIR